MYLFWLFVKSSIFSPQVQKKNLIRSIMEEREMIIDLKIQISMAQYKSRQPNLS